MKEFDIQTKYGKIHIYKKCGGNRTILLLHGSGSDSAMLSWREAVSCFGDEYTVYAPDLLGYGKSDYYENITDDFYNTHIRCIKEITDKLEIDNFLLGGLSMGGAIAIGFALEYPGKVKGLIPVSSWGLSRKMPFHRFSYWYVNKTDMTVVQYRLCAKYRRLAKWSVAYSLIGNKKLITDILIDEVINSCKSDKAGKSMQDYQRSSADKHNAIPFYNERLKELQMPVTFIAGEKDPLVPLKDVQAAHKTAAGSKIYVFKNCKHWTVKEKPEEFCHIVGEFYENIYFNNVKKMI